MSAFRLSRVALKARPVRPAALRSSVQRRGYAEAVSDKIKLSLALPHQVRVLRSGVERPAKCLSSCYCTFTDVFEAPVNLQIHRCVRSTSADPQQVHTALPLRPILILLLDSVQVNIPAESGEMGILANHVPSIEQLKPGLIEIIEESGGSKQFFCSYIIPGFCQDMMVDSAYDSVWRVCSCST
jgi:ATP synthase, Delta/Epsilon chain, beta-sandwich domain